MRLIVVRHGRTEANEQGILQGHREGKLSSAGLSQVESVAERLCVEPVDAIFSSDLQRAADTARMIASFHPRAPLGFDKRLRERSWGSFEGQPAHAWEADLRASALPFHLYRPPGGETVEDLAERVRPFIDELRSVWSGRTVVVVGHHSLNRAIIYHLTDHPIAEWRALQQENTCVNVLQVPPTGRAEAVLLNCTAHLSVARRVPA